MKENHVRKAPNPTSGSFLVLSFAYTPTQAACNGTVEFHMNIQLQVAFSKNRSQAKAPLRKDKHQEFTQVPKPGEAGGE